MSDPHASPSASVRGGSVDDLATIDGNPKRWTGLNITLHWAIVGLLVVQYIGGQWMGEAFRATLVPGNPMGAGLGVVTVFHMVIGATIGILAVARFYDARKWGRPAHFTAEPGWARGLAAVSHYALYALLVGMPIAGLVAYWGGLEWLADLHNIAGKALLAVIALHITGALVSQYYFKADVLKRIMPGRGRFPESKAHAQHTEAP